MTKETNISHRTLLIQRASLTGIVGNAILSVMKVSAGIISGSAAVIADGIDSASDIIASLISNYANSVSERPPDKKHPWGYARIETIATKVISILIFFAGLQLIISTVGRLFSNEAAELPSMLALVVTVLSIIGKATIAMYQSYIGKKADSKMVKADAAHMKNDIYLSAAVLLGLGLTYLTKLTLIDTIIGIALGVWIVWTGAKLSLASNAELMDSFEEQDEMYAKLFSIVKHIPAISNPHRARIRKINFRYDINLDIEIDANLTILQGHEIVKELELEIKKEFINVFDVVIHMEPKGNIEEKQFGLSPKDVGVQ